MLRTLTLSLIGWSLAASLPPSDVNAPAAPRPAVATVLESQSPLGAPVDAGVPDAGTNPHQHHHGAAPTSAIDPVCGMKVDPARAGGGQLTTSSGETLTFCSTTCRDEWLAAHPGGGK